MTKVVATKVRKPRTKKVVSELKVSGGYVSLNDYFKVHLGTYKILERNIKKGVASMLLGPTGVK